MSYEKRNLYTSLVLGRCEKDTETSHGTCCHVGHRKRNATQRTEKAKKETRRQRVVQAVEQVGPFQLFVFFFCFRWFRDRSISVEAWSQELTDFADGQQGDAKQKVR